mmetsp:Transcript_93253/g.237235  ORF Transcript_93253/g.237235 Transcript_93253/m.237235 type:complete len:227 (-) Transcript_93253:103-783(-)
MVGQALLGGMVPPELVALGINVLNYAMFAGGVLIKLPQIVAILRTKTVKGMSETSLATEFLACLSLCAYNLLMGHPFKTWGEMALIGAQCAVQTILFWVYTKDKLSVAPRALVVLLVAAITAVLWLGFLPRALYPALGLTQTALGSFARVPQIILNFRQKHTGNQSIITWGLSLAGNTVRIITTFASVDDFVALAGYLVAFVLNGTLVTQILLFRANTEEALKRKD